MEEQNNHERIYQLQIDLDKLYQIFNDKISENCKLVDSKILYIFNKGVNSIDKNIDLLFKQCMLLHDANNELYDDINTCNDINRQLESMIDSKWFEGDFNFISCNDIIGQFECIVERLKFNFFIESNC